MPHAIITRAPIWEDYACTCMARVVGNAGSVITIATVSTITCKVFNLDDDDPTATTATPSVVVASSVFDTMQTDARWTADATGYNFRFTVPGTAFATPGRHRIEFIVTPSSGDAFPIVFEPTVLPMYGS